MSTHDVQTGISDMLDDLITIEWDFDSNGNLHTCVSAWVKRHTQNAPSGNKSDIEETFWSACRKRVRILDLSIKSGLKTMASDRTIQWENARGAIPEELMKIAKGINDKQGSVTSIRVVKPDECRPFNDGVEYFNISSKSIP
uniref:Uncharacterized protein n=1 Tax=Kwoniella bestiolae CBS 10118 TaxID=1296100 RepID=A0A1B9GAW6_9TREE|nr:hypothetical protein I302_03016 [Kwoniella bestiolae CBS 10118]OCF28165.1 hypothetical protein I302_03016 [Kwoniella bestiolae CBS 10118]